jgi:hypothetical protein
MHPHGSARVAPYGRYGRHGDNEGRRVGPFGAAGAFSLGVVRSAATIRAKAGNDKMRAGIAGTREHESPHELECPAMATGAAT